MTKEQKLECILSLLIVTLFQIKTSCRSCHSNKCYGNMFRSNGRSKFLYFVGKVFDENTGKVSIWLNGWQYFRWMSI